MQDHCIYFDIQHHASAEGLSHLIRALEPAASHIALSFDGPVSALNGLIAENKDLKGLYSIRETLPVYWCGPSQIRNQLEAIKHALSWPYWSYFVNLSGSCVPTKPIRELSDYLQQFNKGLPTIFINSFRVRQLVNARHGVEDGPLTTYRLGRLNIMCSGKVYDHFSDDNVFPLRHIQNRFFFRCLELDPGSRLMHIQTFSTDEYKKRKIFIEKTGIRGGRAWFVASRSFCERLIGFMQTDQGRSLYNMFHDSFEPDETFLHTLCQIDEIRSNCNVIDDNLRFQMGKASSLNGDLIKKALADNSFFARKASPTQASVLLQMIGAMRYKEI